jgi:hypothetical protein
MRGSLLLSWTNDWLEEQLYGSVRLRTHHHGGFDVRHSHASRMLADLLLGFCLCAPLHWAESNYPRLLRSISVVLDHRNSHKDGRTGRRWCSRRFRESYIGLTVTGGCYQKVSLANRVQPLDSVGARFSGGVELRYWSRACSGL